MQGECNSGGGFAQIRKRLGVHPASREGESRRVGPVDGWQKGGMGQSWNPVVTCTKLDLIVARVVLVCQ